MQKLIEQEFKDWLYIEIEIEDGEIPVRIYYRYTPSGIDFKIVELHSAEIPEGVNSCQIDNWDINYSEVEIIGHGWTKERDIWIEIKSDRTTSIETYIKIFNTLKQIEQTKNEKRRSFERK